MRGGEPLNRSQPEKLAVCTKLRGKRLHRTVRCVQTIQMLPFAPTSRWTHRTVRCVKMCWLLVDLKCRSLCLLGPVHQRTVRWGSPDGLVCCKCTGSSSSIFNFFHSPDGPVSGILTGSALCPLGSVCSTDGPVRGHRTVRWAKTSGQRDRRVQGLCPFFHVIS